MRRIIINFIILLSAIPLHSFAEETTFSSIKAIRSNGKASSTTFQLSVSGLDSDTKITTANNAVITLNVNPAADDIGKTADIFNAVLVNKKWWVLDETGTYIPWNGASLKKLVPFQEGVTLEKSLSIDFLSGKFNIAGELRYFFAYVAEGSNYFVLTPKPFKLNVVEGGSDTGSEALTIYKKDVEQQIVQSRCVICHVDGGLARNSSLIFSHKNELAPESNFNILKDFISLRDDGVNHILDTSSGGNNHPGGVQLSKNSELYKVFENVLRSIVNGKAGNVINFGQPTLSKSDSLTLFSGAQHESKVRTLRRAALILAARLPSENEISKVLDGTESDLDEVLLGFMEEKGFHEFLIEGVEDRLLIRGGMCGVNSAHPNFVKLRELVWEHESTTGEPADRIGNLAYWSCQRTAGELVAYVVENNLPYSEIITADYMMMNQPLNDYLGGTAEFNESEYWTFKPSRIMEYYTRNNIQESDEAIFTFHNKLDGYSNPLRPYPHAGLLTDLGFLARYPTTATNRNRARARWTFYHFLNIDIEKSSQRPTDPQALADTNNPTMNNGNCTVCHSTLDPVAGAFQNWDENDLYRPGNGKDSLDGFYKYPPDGSISMYEEGDVWYRDMREPGLFEYKINDDDYTLQELANLIIAEDAFYESTVKFWWPSVFGHEMLDKPVVESDTDYPSRILAYNQQQLSLNEFSEILKNTKNLKSMLLSMIKSPWSTVVSLDDDVSLDGMAEASITEFQLLNPIQLVNKTEFLTGLIWGRHLTQKNNNPYGRSGKLVRDYNLVYGGHDSKNVTKRSDNLTALTLDVVLQQAAELACPATAIDLYRNPEDRLIFKNVDENLTPNEMQPFSLSTSESRNLRTYLVELVERFHGNYYDIDDDEIIRIHNIFVEVFLSTKEENLDNLSIDQFCWPSGADAEFPQLLGLNPYDYSIEDNGWLRHDWEKFNDQGIDLYKDQKFTKRAWQFVLIYLMAHYNYIHE